MTAMVKSDYEHNLFKKSKKNEVNLEAVIGIRGR